MMGRKNVLIEIVNAPVTILSEGKDGDGRMHIKAKLLEAGIKNRNNRVYPVEIVQREVGKLQERITAGVAFGSGGHPQDGMTSFSDVSHVWRKVWMEGPSVFGEATVLNAGRGAVLQEVIRVTGSVPVSVRGFGTCARGEFEGKPADIVESSYQMVTADVVLNDQGFEDAKVTQVREDAAPEGGGETMDVKELREKHPDLVKALADEVEAQVTAKLTKAFEEKILARLGEEKDAIREAVKKEVADELGVAAMREALEAIGIAVAPFAGAPEDAPKADADTAALRKEVEDLTARLNTIGQGLKETQGENDRLKADLEAAKVPAYIAEKVKLERGAQWLVEELKGCRTTKEVDERLPDAKAKVGRMLEMAPELAGRGAVPPENGGGEPEMNEEQKRQRRLAGIPV